MDGAGGIEKEIVCGPKGQENGGGPGGEGKTKEMVERPLWRGHGGNGSEGGGSTRQTRVEGTDLQW